MTGYKGEHVLGEILLKSKYESLRESAAWALGISIPSNAVIVPLHLTNIYVDHSEFYSMYYYNYY